MEAITSEREANRLLPDVDSRGTIVVCEDDQVTLELLIENLEADRYHALAAPTGADALRFCRYSQPDLLLLDLALPDGLGLDVLRRIRGSEGAAAEIRQRSAGDRAQRSRREDSDRVRGLQRRRGRLPGEAVPLPGAARADRERPRVAAEAGAPARSRSGR